MSRIKIAELKQVSELKVLSDRETSAIIGGSEIENEIDLPEINLSLSIDVSAIFQINNNISVQVAINGDNFNVADLSNIIE